MIRNPSFELVEVAGEYLAIPTGDFTSAYDSVVVLSEAAFDLLKSMGRDRNRDELVALLLDLYDVDAETAGHDVDELLASLREMELILDHAD